MKKRILVGAFILSALPFCMDVYAIVAEDTVARPVSGEFKVEDEIPRWDFGKDFWGWMEFKAEKPGGYIFRIGERVDGEGRVMLKPGGSLRAYEVPVIVTNCDEIVRLKMPRDRRNTTGAPGNPAVQIPEKFGVIAPLRYAELIAGPKNVRKDSLVFQTVTFPHQGARAEFECDNEDLNRVWELCAHTIDAVSFAGYYVDGERERIPYECDSFINMLSDYSLYSDYRMGTRTLDYLMDHPTWPTEWKQYVIMMAYYDFLYTGDKSLIARRWDLMKKEKLMQQYARADGLLETMRKGKPIKGGPKGCTDIVDWPKCERDNFDFRPVNAVVNALYYINLVEMSEMAAALGKDDEKREFAARAEKILKRYNEVFYNPKTGLYVDGEGSSHSSFHANCFAVAFGLVPKSRRDKILDYCLSRWQKASPFPQQFLLEALFDNDRVDDAIAVMTAKGPRTWLGMLDQGATTTTEAWDFAAKPNQDWCHAWGTGPLNVIVRKMLKERKFGSLKWVKAKYPTPNGVVEVK